MSAKTAWLGFWYWCGERRGWQVLAGFTYLSICLFDFVIVPSWIGIHRVDVLAAINVGQFAEIEPSIQLRIIDSLTYQHEPLTLRGGGVFHLAFGALLTGSAISPLK